jgi:hypothetical protein
MKARSNRREFVGSIGVIAAAMSCNVGGLSPAPLSATKQIENGLAHSDRKHRAMLCGQIRKRAALANAEMRTPANEPNGDEHLYPTKAASYHKGLPHNQMGEVDLSA